MTVTLSIDGSAGASGADVTVSQINQAALVYNGTTLDPKVPGKIVTNYALPSLAVDLLLQPSLRVQTQKDPKSVTSVRRSLIELTTWARSVDSVTGDVLTAPIVAGTYINSPGINLEAADVLQLVEILFGLHFKTLTSKVPDSVVISSHLAGVTNVW